MAETFRTRLSVPPEDVSVLTWLAAQHNVSVSLRLLIKEEVRRSGYVDYMNKPVSPGVPAQPVAPMPQPAPAPPVQSAEPVLPAAPEPEPEGIPDEEPVAAAQAPEPAPVAAARPAVQQAPQPAAAPSGLDAFLTD